MSAGERAAALLLDADNLSDAATLDAAIAELQARGLRLTIRRAYGGHEKLAGLKDCLARHGFRSLVNNGKGTTDAMLVVDTMDLLHQGGLPDVIALASSDGDFAPLAVRLREAGTRTLCLAQRNKAAGDELAKVYDEVIFLDDGPAPAAARERAPRAARKTASRKTAAAKAPAPADPVRDLLAAVPGFESGRWIEMNEAVKRLRDASLMAKSGSSQKFFAKNAPYVELAPEGQPNKLRLKAA